MFIKLTQKTFFNEFVRMQFVPCIIGYRYIIRMINTNAIWHIEITPEPFSQLAQVKVRLTRPQIIMTTVGNFKAGSQSHKNVIKGDVINRLSVFHSILIIKHFILPL